MDPTSLDNLWLIICAALVFLMQGGFLCIESGCTRIKNSINVAVKNLSDFGISVLSFWMIGFGLMFGASFHGLWGGSFFFYETEAGSPGQVSFFLFQAMFCGTSITIVSGAVAERMSFKAYLFVSAFVSVFVYPIFGHWAWGGVLGGKRGWLAELGFIDFAGSSVVHSIGGWVALACIWVLGPRLGRFDENGKSRPIHGQSLPLAMLGALLLCFGWVGFNGGSTLAWGGDVPRIVANTVLGAASGMIASLGFSFALSRYPDTKFVMNGMLAGLVAITANCHIITSTRAIVIGAVGGLVMVIADRLVERLKLDDVVGAFSAHAAAGIWGTLAVALFGNTEAFLGGAGRWEQLGIQGLGVLVCAAVGFIPAFLCLKLLSMVASVRVSVDDELVGLNTSEHRVSTAHLDLLREMQSQSQAFDISRRVNVEPFTEAGQIAQKYNEVLDSLEETVLRNELIIRDTKDGILTCSQAGKVLSANQGAAEMFGRSMGELEGGSLWELVQREDGQPSISFAILRALSSEQLAEEEPRPFVGLNATDGQFPVEIELVEGMISGEAVFTVKIRDRSRSEQYKAMLVREKRVAERTRDELREKIRQIEAFNGIVVDRELRMIELKKKINGLSEELDREPPYKAEQLG